MRTPFLQVKRRHAIVSLCLLSLSIVAAGAEIKFGERKISAGTYQDEVLLDLDSEVEDIQTQLDELTNDISQYQQSLYGQKERRNFIQVSVRGRALTSFEDLRAKLDDLEIYRKNGPSVSLDQKEESSYLIYVGPIKPGKHKVSVSFRTKSSETDAPLSKVEIERQMFIEVPEGVFEGAFTLELDSQE